MPHSKTGEHTGRFFLFLLGFYLLSDGVTAVIYFTSIYLSTTFAMPVAKILVMTIIIQAVGLVVGLVVGSSQAICRSINARIVPVEKQAEFFGFNAMSGRVATLLGPLVFGLVSTSTGSQRIGLMSLLVFFIAGGVVDSMSKLDGGQRKADVP